MSDYAQCKEEFFIENEKATGKRRFFKVIMWIELALAAVILVLYTKIHHYDGGHDAKKVFLAATAMQAAACGIQAYKAKRISENNPIKDWRAIALSIAFYCAAFGTSIAIFSFDPEHFWPFYVVAIVSFYPRLVIDIYNLAANRIHKNKLLKVVVKKVNGKREASIKILKELRLVSEKLEKVYRQQERV